MGKNQLIQEMCSDNDGDSWGWAMSWWFAVSDHLHFLSDVPVPAEWEFRPSPLGMSTEDLWQLDILSEYSPEEWLAAGRILHRYTALLRRHGKDY